MRRRILFLGAFLCLLLTGCVTKERKTDKLKDLEYTVLEEEAVPEEFKAVIEAEKEKPFYLTYTDAGELYIAQGYGVREKTGYSVEVKSLCETENAVYIHTNLSGPEKGTDTKDIATYPYVVVKLEAVEKRVIFE